MQLPLALRTFEPGAFATQPVCGPKATLADYMFHSLEPPWVKGMVIWEIKRLQCAGERVDAIAHAWPVRYRRPAAFGSCEGTLLRHTKKKDCDAPLTIPLAVIVSDARFMCPGALSNKKRPWARPFVLASKIPMARSTCSRSSFAVK